MGAAGWRRQSARRTEATSSGFCSARGRCGRRRRPAAATRSRTSSRGPTSAGRESEFCALLVAVSEIEEVVFRGCGRDGGRRLEQPSL